MKCTAVLLGTARTCAVLKHKLSVPFCIGRTIEADGLHCYTHLWLSPCCCKTEHNETLALLCLEGYLCFLPCCSRAGAASLYMPQLV